MTQHFHSFTSIVSEADLPLRFTYPFHYDAHPLTVEAAHMVQAQLKAGALDEQSAGKMYGVLVVRTVAGEIGFLAAYSGNALAVYEPSLFVPPIVDPTEELGYFRKEEAQLTAINVEVKRIEQSPSYVSAKAKLAEAQKTSLAEIDCFKKKAKAAKIQRKIERADLMARCEGEPLQEALEALNSISLNETNVFTRLKRDWKTKIAAWQADVDALNGEMETLKSERKRRSNALQQWLFDEYQLLNVKGEVQGLTHIFRQSTGTVPPAGTGDCAAPRLLQYAFDHKMEPLCMAEFWWGQSPKTIIRRHGDFYPSCTSKCKPILGHMLQGLAMDENPLASSQGDIVLDMVYEDDDVLVVNKAAGLLSVPGKDGLASIYDAVVLRVPSALSVHRLDMATSGLLLFAKSAEVHKLLQAQFLSRQVKKRYVALLEGVVQADGGKIDLPLCPDIDNRPQQMVNAEHGKAAMTIWRVLERGINTTRVHFFPITGRTHQLRVHAAHSLGLHCPIVGDSLYGNAAERMCLHAETLEFIHPISQEKMKLKCKADF